AADGPDAGQKTVTRLAATRSLRSGARDSPPLRSEDCASRLNGEPPMEPRHYYALFMLLALVVFVVVRYLQPRMPGLAALPWWQRLALALAAFVGGVLGAKASFALAETNNWLSLDDWKGAWFKDGKTITTGLIGAYLSVEIAKLALGIRVKTGDSFALPIAAAMAVGRWGCFFNGCCYGTPTDLPWGVPFRQLDGDIVRCHPT